MPQIKFINKRSKPILTLQWNDPKDILAWAAMVKDSGVEFRNVDGAVPVTLQGDGEPLPPDKAKPEPRFITKEEAVDLYCGVTTNRPVLNWKVIMRDSFHGTAKRNVELPEFMARYKAKHKSENIIGKI